jgi:hypothetical protein
MSRGIVSAELHRTERVELEARQEDPESPAVGERWLRIDLSDTSNDKLAELRWYDGSNTNGINVVAPGSTDSGVEEVLRIETSNGTGVVPAIAPPADANYGSQRLRHNGTTYGLGAGVPIEVVESWENGISSAWSGETSSFSIDTSRAADGSQCLSGSGGPDAINSSEDDGLSRYPEKGDVIEWSSNTTAVSGRKDFIFGNVKIEEHHNNQSVILTDPDGTSKSSGYTPPTNEWIEYEVAFDNPVEVSVYEDGSEVVSLSSSYSGSLSEGDIEIAFNSGEHRHDYLRIGR